MTTDAPTLLNPDAARADLTAAAAAAGRARGVLVLVAVTVVWGTTFVATRVLVAGRADPVPPSVLTLARFALAAALFAPFLRGGSRALWVAGAELGLWAWVSYAAQAIGLQHIGASRSAFITTLHVVFVPTLAALAGRRVGGPVWAAVGLAVAGTALLSYDGPLRPNRGDAWTLVTAAGYAVYIVRLERVANRFGAMMLTAVQLVTVAVLAGGWVLAEVPTMAPVRIGWADAANIAYLAVVATALTTWLQAVGQRTVPGPQASLLYTLEPVFATAVAWLAFGEWFGLNGWAGAGMILAAAVVSQWRRK